jgi:thioredoxin 1
MSGANTVDVNTANWKQEVETAAIPVVVDFWAPWCGPCRAIAPILDQIAVEMSGKIKVCKVNIDENQDIAAKFGVQSIPTLLVFKKGVVQEQMVGAVPKATLVAKLSKHLVA